jgi:hypothetical protein
MQCFSATALPKITSVDELIELLQFDQGRRMSGTSLLVSYFAPRKLPKVPNLEELKRIAEAARAIGAPSALYQYPPAHLPEASYGDLKDYSKFLRQFYNFTIPKIPLEILSDRAKLDALLPKDVVMDPDFPFENVLPDLDLDTLLALPREYLVEKKGYIRTKGSASQSPWS